MRAAIYALRAWCQRRGWSPVEYLDTLSGSKFTRLGLDSMMQAVRRGKLDVIVCYKLDRIGRSLPHLALLIQELTNHRCALVCTSQGIDTSNESPVAKLQLGILMAVAEFERDIIRERVIAGLAAAKARGQKLGRRDKLSQYRAKVAELRAAGLGIRAIARQLKLPPASVHKLTK
jgi:DNA invertase Pin-like site-specific DNA recombinase